MSSDGACREVRHQLAVYVLGAIEPGDRDVVNRHIVECGDCRRELAGLAGLPALLRRVPPGEAFALLAAEPRGCRGDLPSTALRQTLTLAGRNRRHQLQIRIAAAAAVGVIGGAGALAGWQAANPVAQPSVRAAGWEGTARAANPHTGAAAIVRYAARPWGLQLSVQISGIPAGTTCQVKVIGAGNAARAADAGGWTIGSGSTSWYPASSAVPLANVHDFEVTSGSKVLVTVPIRAATGPSGGQSPRKVPGQSHAALGNRPGRPAGWLAR